MEEKNYIDNFLSLFEKSWLKFISDIQSNINVQDSQLFSGNRLRPQLVFWGYYLGCEYDNHIFNVEELIELAIPFEAIHKASIIIDDIIDKDEYRKGKHSFHSQFGIDNSMLYSIMLLINSIKAIEKNEKLFINKENIMISVISTMCSGALIEINSNNNFQSMDDTLAIIKSETVELIKRCFDYGFRLACKKRATANDMIESIGENIGLIFQILNDAEPFFNPQYINMHKGTLNYDINKSGRKNYIVAFLYGLCSTDDLKKFDDISYDELVELIIKYNLKEVIVKQIADKSDYIYNKIEQLKLKRTDIFREYYKGLLQIAINRALGE